MSGKFQVERIVSTDPTAGCRIDNGAPVATNCWLVGDDTDVVVVDPAGAPEEIADAVGDRFVTAVICTHGSRSHCSAAVELAYGLCAPMLLHPADHLLWEQVHGDSGYWWLHNGQRIAVAGEEIRVLHTPSPTAGSVSLYLDRPGVLLTGDALGPRRPVGGRVRRRDPDAIPEAVQGLPLDTYVLPGHGDSFVLSQLWDEQTDRLVERSA